MASVDIFELTEGLEKLVPQHIDNFQDWVDSLSKSEFGDYAIMCNKEEASTEDNTHMLNMALVLFFRECDIDSMPMVEELLIQLLGEFKKAIIRVGLARKGRMIIDGPIRLEREMIPCGGVKVYSI